MIFAVIAQEVASGAGQSPMTARPTSDLENRRVVPAACPISCVARVAPSSLEQALALAALPIGATYDP